MAAGQAPMGSWALWVRLGLLGIPVNGAPLVPRDARAEWDPLARWDPTERRARLGTWALLEQTAILVGMVPRAGVGAKDPEGMTVCRDKKALIRLVLSAPKVRGEEWVSLVLLACLAVLVLPVQRVIWGSQDHTAMWAPPVCRES